MIQRHTLLIKPRFLSGTTSPVIPDSSNLISANRYQVNNEQNLGIGITSENNIRGFLSNSANQNINNDFVSYLRGRTSSIQFSEIYSSDQKLSNVFNNYYESSVIKNQTPPIDVINSSLTGTVRISVKEHQYYNYNGRSFTKGLLNIPLSINNSTRRLITYQTLDTQTDDDSYYIPVNIKRNHNELEQQKFFEEENILNIINQYFPDPDTGGNVGNYDY